MPNTILLNVPSVVSSKLPHFKAGCDLAVARGFQGVRASAGVSNYPFATDTDLSNIDTSDITAAVTYAAASGIGKVSFLLNPWVKGADATLGGTGLLYQTFNCVGQYTVKSRPPLGSAAIIGGVAYSSLRDWIGRVVWQQLIDAARSAAIAAGKNPVTFLEFEGFNEPGIGGNMRPVLTDTNTYPTPYDGYASGYIEPGFFTLARQIAENVDFHGIPFVVMTLEAAGTSEAQTEVNSVTGADATALFALGTKAAFNRYADTVLAPYSAAAVKAAFSAKVAAQVTRMQANPILSGMTLVIREFGINNGKQDGSERRVPRCVHANAVRNALIEQMKDQAGIVEAGLFCAYNPGSSPAEDEFKHFCYDELTQNPALFDGQRVHITA